VGVVFFCYTVFLFFLFLADPRTRAPPKHRQKPATCFPPPVLHAKSGVDSQASSPQRSVHLALIFRLLLKITVDWPYNATCMCL